MASQRGQGWKTKDRNPLAALLVTAVEVPVVLETECQRARARRKPGESKRRGTRRWSRCMHYLLSEVPLSEVPLSEAPLLSMC